MIPVRIPLLVLTLLFFSCEKTPPAVPQSHCYTCGYPVGPGYNYYGSLETSGSENWDNWGFRMGDTTGHYETVGTENWDYWNFNMAGVYGYIETVGSENWDYWKLTGGSRSIHIETVGSENWDYWSITEYSTGFSARMETSGSDNFDNWRLYINGTYVMSIETSGSENWDYWTFGSSDLGDMDLYQLSAVLFIPIYTAAVHQQGIDQ